MTFRPEGCAVHSFLSIRSQMDCDRFLLTWQASTEISTRRRQLKPRCARSPVGALSVLLTIR